PAAEDHVVVQDAVLPAAPILRRGPDRADPGPGHEPRAERVLELHAQLLGPHDPVLHPGRLRPAGPVPVPPDRDVRRDREPGPDPARRRAQPVLDQPPSRRPATALAAYTVSRS